MAGAGTGEVGWGAAVGVGVGGRGFGVGVGATVGIGVGVGAMVAAGVGVTELTCPVGAEPQEARTLMTMTDARTTITLFVPIFLGGSRRRAIGPKKL